MMVCFLQGILGVHLELVLEGSRLRMRLEGNRRGMGAMFCVALKEGRITIPRESEKALWERGHLRLPLRVWKFLEVRDGMVDSTCIHSTASGQSHRSLNSE